MAFAVLDGAGYPSVDLSGRGWNVKADEVESCGYSKFGVTGTTPADTPYARSGFPATVVLLLSHGCAPYLQGSRMKDAFRRRTPCA